MIQARAVVTPALLALMVASVSRYALPGYGDRQGLWVQSPVWPDHVLGF